MESSPPLATHLGRRKSLVHYSGRNCTHFHDGKSYKLVTTYQPPASKDEEMQTTCEDLRQRLVEVAEEAK
jgi:hypothetical protein